MKLRTTFGAMLIAAFSAAPAFAKPIAPSTLCMAYPSSPVCRGGLPTCTFCHTTPPARNTFGAELSAALLPGMARPLSDEAFAAGLSSALAVVETADSDGDTFSNLDELLAGSYPGNKDSVPFEVGSYDPRYVYKKVHLDFCGETSTYDDLAAFDARQDQATELHEALDRCLDSEAWLGKDGALYRIAHKKIRPVQSIKSGDDAGDIPLGDYFDDYKLFVYTQIDNHDARELLTAKYFVESPAGAPTRYSKMVRSPLEDVALRGVLVAQLVDPGRRAGMLTTRWNFVLNTMFTPIPRTTAAQAYRAFLGLDIARSEGLDDVPGEPVDYDRKGVTAPACARCHATLDPLTYPFTRYSGFTGGLLPFSYSPERMNNLSTGPADPLRDTPEAGVIFDRPVRDLVEWAEVAANSEAFAQATVLDYWRFLTGEPPRPTEQVEFDQLWRDLMTKHDYGVERMLHDLIDTEAYGVP